MTILTLVDYELQNILNTVHTEIAAYSVSATKFH